MGTFRLGFLMNFLSKPVLSGFTSAAALIIGFSQTGNLLGVEVQNSKYLYQIVRQVISNLENTHIPTMVVGLSCVILIILFSRWKSRWPVQFLVVVGAIGAVWFFRLDQAGVDIVGRVKAGFPAPGIPPVTDVPFWSVLPTILAIAFLGFIQSIALAKVMVRRNPNESDINCRLIFKAISTSITRYSLAQLLFSQLQL